MSVESHEGVRHQKNGARGIIFRVAADSVKWLDKDSAEIKGGYFESGHSASASLYPLRRINGAWIVLLDRLLWVS
jgi:hypothetical protein